MPGTYLVTVTLEHADGVPEDRFVNTFPIFTIDNGLATEAELEAAMNDISRFYNEENTTRSVASVMSAEASRTAGAHLLRAYLLDGHLDGSAHGSAVAELPMTLAAAGGEEPLPAECAVVLTTRGFTWAEQPIERADGVDPGSAVDRPRQRFSGRLYVGPLNAAAGDLSGLVYRVDSDFVVDLLDAGERLQDELVADGFVWAVWSRVDERLAAITDLQVDNAFDTMRKRGPDASVRTTRASIFVP